MDWVCGVWYVCVAVGGEVVGSVGWSVERLVDGWLRRCARGWWRLCGVGCGVVSAIFIINCSNFGSISNIFSSAVPSSLRLPSRTLSRCGARLSSRTLSRSDFVNGFSPALLTDFVQVGLCQRTFSRSDFVHGFLEQRRLVHRSIHRTAALAACATRAGLAAAGFNVFNL